MSRLVFAILLFFTQSALCQDLYNIQYTDKNRTRYDCLLIDDGGMYLSIRMKFSEAGKAYLAELKYRSTAGLLQKAGGEEFLHFKTEAMYGSAIKFLSEDAYPGFVAPCFVWYPGKGQLGALNPLYTTTDYVNYTGKRKVELCEQIGMEDISKGRLKPFFPDGGYLYESLTKQASLSVKAVKALPALKNNPTLHFIMVVNNADPKIGASCTKDRENLERELKAVTSSIGINYRPYIITASDKNKFNRQALLAQVNAINPAPDDIVFFSYSGHGARWEEQEDPYPFMELWVTPPFNAAPAIGKETEVTLRMAALHSVALSEVWDMITKKGARLNIVLGDMCNTSIGTSSPVDLDNILDFGNALRAGTEITRRDPVKLRKLFIESSGSILSNAAKPSEKSAGNATAGGYYTASFVETLRRAGSYNNDPMTWEKIINQTIDQALAYRQTARPKEVQNGIRFMEIKE